MRPLLRFSRQNAVGLLALFVALGGTSYAAVALPKNSVGANQIKTNAVGSSELRRGAVSNSDLASGAVTASKIRGNSVTSSKVKPGSLLASDFKAGELPKPAATPAAPTSATPSGAAGGALSGTYPNPGLAAGSVTASTLGELPAIRLIRDTATTQAIASVANPAQSTGVILPTTEYNNADPFEVGTAPDGGAVVTAPVSGVYAVSAQVIWADPSVAGAAQDNGNGTRSLFISGPQPGGVRASSTVPAVSGTTTRQSISTSEYFAAGDEISLSAAQTSGVSVNIRGSQNQVHLSATLLTP